MSGRAGGRVRWAVALPETVPSRQIGGKTGTHLTSCAACRIKGYHPPQGGIFCTETEITPWTIAGALEASSVGLAVKIKKYSTEYVSQADSPFRGDLGFGAVSPAFGLG